MKRKYLSVILVLFLSVILISGCSSSSSDNGGSYNPDEGSKWKSFSTNSFGVMYLNDWNTNKEGGEIDENVNGYIYQFLNNNRTSGLEIVVIENNTGDITEAEFIEFKDLIINIILDDYVYDVYEEESETTIDGEKAYRIIFKKYNYNEEDQIEDTIITYKGNKIFALSFIDTEDKFNDSQEIGERIFGSFEFLY